MNQSDYQQLFGYELHMTQAWQQFQSGACSGLRLFELQEQQGLRISMRDQMLGGHLEQQVISVGMHHGRLMLTFQTVNFRHKLDRYAGELTVSQSAELNKMLDDWLMLCPQNTEIIHGYERNDMDWLPKLPDILRLGVCGLYDLYRTEAPEYADYPGYISILNDSIDRYKYIACQTIVADPQNTNAQRIYNALGRIKYLPPKTTMETLQMLLLHLLIFRPTHLEALDTLLQPYYDRDILLGNETVSSLKNALFEFWHKYRAAVQALGKQVRIGIAASNDSALTQLLADVMDQ